MDKILQAVEDNITNKKSHEKFRGWKVCLLIGIIVVG